jgi:hypothetical protein
MNIVIPCFWKNFEGNNYIFCEKQICGLIVEPANTWSNIGYLIVAILIFNSRHTGTRTRGRFFWSTLVLFLGSTLFHMSGTWWGKFLDVGAMFCLSMAILTTSLERKYKIEKQNGIIIFVVGIVLSLIYLYFMKLGLFLFASQIALSAFLEKRNIQRFWKALVCFGVAFIFWILDVKRFWCNPDNHFISGHAVWHLFAAASIWMFYKSYESMDDSRVH